MGRYFAHYIVPLGIIKVSIALVVISVIGTSLSLNTFISSPLSPKHIAAAPLSNFTGYKLPWQEGVKGTVTRRDGAGHQNQVDFDI